MKKYFILTFLIASTVFGASAQLLPSIQLGVKGGLNFSTLRSEDGGWLDASTRTGYQAGIWARIGGAGVHFQPELYITGKSSEAKLVDRDEEGKVTFTSLDLPLLLGTRVGLGLAGLRIHAGPVVSFVVDKNIGQSLQQVTQFSEYKNQAWAVTGGLGVDISNFRADLRYEHGLSELSKNDSAPQKVNLWTIGIGYRLF
ncbi:Outer membrane protein beta-barrel domain-containing protein [Parapedobacter composti]|uniref:Outer membrane protein beta-barrel domain-containing protein n=1 Tax=Parapedobacter composti TaxID=623281 RepID=A0A1I1EV17_9SPHI|nr:porin family protein [Parapedobacter composti]SFB90944.1 Outer membrane protein beta-barrel domain-containing protein [Parapedobacter composti]